MEPHVLFPVLTSAGHSSSHWSRCMKFCFAFTFQILQMVSSPVFSIRNASVHFPWLPCMLLALLPCPPFCYHSTVSHIAVRSNCMCIEQVTALRSLCAPDTNHHFGCGVHIFKESLVWKCYLGMKSTLKVPDTVVFKKFMNLNIHVILGVHPFQYCDASWLVLSNWGLHHVCWVTSYPIAVV